MGLNNQYEFIFDKRLGIKIPSLKKEWDDYTELEQLEIIHLWELERAKIPDKVKNMENKIENLQDLIFDIDFDDYLKIHEQIVDLSSAINDLNIWYRTSGELNKE